MSSDIPVLVIVGPSGVGKTTLCNELLKEFSKNIEFSISHTSRNIRDGETHGINYYFISDIEFNKMRENDEFIECTSYVGSQYGTSKKEIERIFNLGKIPLLDIDVEGFKQLNRHNIPLRGVFVSVSTTDILRQRLLKRGKDNEESIKKRLEQANQEIEASKTLNFDYYLINENILESYVTLRSKLLEWYSNYIET